eukprot:scaffold29468_cov18-Tisochrysis_lutea.AAC.1
MMRKYGQTYKEHSCRAAGTCSSKYQRPLLQSARSKLRALVRLQLCCAAACQRRRIILILDPSHKHHTYRSIQLVGSYDRMHASIGCMHDGMRDACMRLIPHTCMHLTCATELVNTPHLSVVQK